MKARTQVNIVLAAVIAVLGIIILLQNLSPVTTQLLFVKVEMPNAILLLVTIGIGFAIGVITAGIIGAKKK